MMTITRDRWHRSLPILAALAGLAAGGCQGLDGRPGGSRGPGLTGLTGVDGDDTGGDTEGDASDEGDDEGHDDQGMDDDGLKFDLPDDPPPPDSGGDEECAAVSEAAELVPVPADIVVVVDNSGSMGFETSEIQARLNDFSNQIIASGIDVHVVLISSYPGTGYGICIDPPLGGGGCPGADANPPVFTHVNSIVSSHNAWDRILSNHMHWSGAMRPDSIKHLVVVTDDTSSIGWQDFDATFRGLDPSYADYVHHSVVCHSYCPSAAGIGSNYITLSMETGGVAADLCDQNFQAVFDVLSTEVIGGSALSCELAIPAPPGDMEFDPDEVNVEFDDGMGGSLEIGRVDSPAQCGGVPHGWYYDDPLAPSTIVMCPQTCDMMQLAENGSIDIAFGCATIPAG